MSIKGYLVKSYMRLARVLRGVSDSVTFESFLGKNYSDNPKAISEKLHEIAPEIKICWLLKKDSSWDTVPAYVHCIDADDKWARLANLTRAKCFVTNFSLPTLPKSRKQLFIQTWHGDKAFKKVMHDSDFAKADMLVPEEVPGYCDLAVAGSAYGKRQYQTAFRYTGEILMEGTPRNDRLVIPDADHQGAIRQSLKLDAAVKLLLYAPTLRREQSNTKTEQPIQELDLSRTLDVLEQRDGCKWLCLVRAHPSIVGLSGAGEDSRIVDVSGYPDMADLLEIADLLITDYSSCAGDFLLTGRPVVLFQADLADYLEKDRALYFDMAESPYWAVDSQKALEEKLRSITPEAAEKNCKDVLAFYGDCETGHAALRVARIIKEWMEK